MPRSPGHVDHLAHALALLLDTPRALAELQAQVASLTEAIRSMERHLPSPLVTAEEAARVLGTSSATIRRWASAGEIPVLRVGRRIPG